MKAGLQFADRITTVSPSYAVEIQQDEGGMGLGGLLRARSDVLSGIINGIDTSVWNPETDPRIASTLQRQARWPIVRTTKPRCSGGSACRSRPTRSCSVSSVECPGRRDSIWFWTTCHFISSEGMQLALLGVATPISRRRYRTAANSHRDQIGVVIGYDENLAHLIQAGADALLVPSRFEPCGLTQLCALRYGAIPVVSRVGGLADTVIDANEMAVAGDVATGIQFWPVSSESLGSAISRAKALFQNKPVWQSMQKNGMNVDVSWRNPARQYAGLYRKLARPRQVRGRSTPSDVSPWPLA